MEENKSNEIKEKITSKVTIGEVLSPIYIFGFFLSITISYLSYYSLKWAIIHGIFSWIYVIYYAINYCI